AHAAHRCTSSVQASLVFLPGFDVSIKPGAGQTVQLAYVRLEALRVIRRQQGKGVFVTDPKTWMREP
ncbi:hypothetical protein AB0L43_22060, partial [Micromonospora globbae]